MGRKTIIEQLGEYRKMINKEIPISKMILFGSRAWGKPHRDSDIDIIVVSPVFKDVRRLDRGVDLHLKWNLHYPVDILCYTPEEFKKKKKFVGIVQQAVKEGIEIKAS